MDTTLEIKCKDCDGEGTYEYGPVCSKPASMCCGGCFETMKCEECSGGFITTDLSDIELDELVKDCVIESGLKEDDLKIAINDDCDIVNLIYKENIKLNDKQMEYIKEELPDELEICLLDDGSYEIKLS